MENFKNKKVAIVVDWLIDFGGAELVIQELLDMFPNAEIFTSVCFMKHKMLENRKIHTSFIQKIPFLNRKHKLAGILRPWAFRQFDLSEFDVIICSSSAESKNVACGKWRKKTSPQPSPKREGEKNSQNEEIWDEKILQTQEVRGSKDFSKWVDFLVNEWEKSATDDEIRRGSRIFVYCHTPIRYYWSHYEEYLNMMEFGKFFNPIAKFIFPKLVNWLRKKDYEAAAAVDVFWANSRTTAERIQKFYHRDAEVIYPWVDEANFAPTDAKKDFYFGMGRCIPYKKFDLMVEAFNKNGKKLKLATNTDNLLYRELKAKSQPNIEWIFAPSSEERKKLYAEAKAFLFPPEEDFGLVPVEAMISGTSVIGYGVGGATETIVEGKTGTFFSPQTADALNIAIEKFEKMELKKDEIIARGQEFTTKNFRKNIFKSLEKNLKNG